MFQIRFKNTSIVFIANRGFRLSLRRNENINSANSNQAVDKLKSKLFEVMSVYEEAIGLKEIKQAQQSVLDAEKKFVDAQNDRRLLNSELIDAQQKLRTLRDEMDRLSRTDSRYLKLFTEEHSLLQSESKLVSDYKLKESQERDLFFYLSAALRDSQEKERARIERIKYLQLGLSIMCTTLGILSAYLLNYFRNANIREILNYDKEQFESVQGLISEIVNKQSNIELSLSKSLDQLDDGQKRQYSLVSSLIEKSNLPVDEKCLIEPSIKNEGLNNDHYLRIHPYMFSAIFLLSFIIYLNK